MTRRAILWAIAGGVIVSACLLLRYPSLIYGQQASQLPPATSPSRFDVSLRELDFPYYNLTGGYQSTLLLVSDSPNPMDFTLAIRSSQGLMLTTAKTIQSGEKLSIDLASLITQLGGDPAGAYGEGSVAAYFTGTIMPLVGQISIRNPQLSLAHEAEMVENDPGRSDVPAELDGEWWGLGTGREAKVMVSNTSDAPQIAEVYLDFQGARHKLTAPLSFVPYETKTVDLSQLLLTLGVDPAQAPEGGITIIQAGPNPALIANGKITDPATGFSSTIDFPLPENEHASALHASGLPIGTPSAGSPFAGAGNFTPHVVVRNLLGTPQTVTITVEYPQPAPASSVQSSAQQSSDASITGSGNGRRTPRPVVPGDPTEHPEWGAGTGATIGSFTLAPLPVAAYSTMDYPLGVALGQLPLPLPFCSIRIQYSGAPGSLEAKVSSVESRSNLIVDARVENEGNGWAGSGANPWRLDQNTESILFLTNESSSTARIAFKLTAAGTPYYLTELMLQPHETRAIDIRLLRDAQIADFKSNKISATAEDGSVSWVRIDNVPVMGRLMVISRSAGMTSSYDCCFGPCPNSDVALEYTNAPSNWQLLVQSTAQLGTEIMDQDCNYNQYYYFPNSCYWSSWNTGVATVDSTGWVTGAGGGSTTIEADLQGTSYECGNNCNADTVPLSTTTPVAVQVPTSLSIVANSSSTTSESQCTTTVNGQQQTGCGVTRTFTYQIDDQNGNPIQQSMTVWDAISVNQQSNGLGMSQPNTTCTGTSAGTNNGPCGITSNSQGQFGEALADCSTYCWNGQTNACVSSSTSTSATQTPHAGNSTLQNKALTYQCGNVLVNGQ